MIESYGTIVKNYEKLEKIKRLVETYPEYEERDEDFNPGDASGENFDDAYQMGVEDGEAYLAFLIKGFLSDEQSGS